MTIQITTSPATEIHDHLEQLLVERRLAAAEGLGANETYMANLDAEIAATRSAYVGTAVTELATLRGELSGRLQG